MRIPIVVISAALLLLTSYARADVGFVQHIAGVSCTPSSQTVDNDVYITQAGNVRFDEGRTGIFYLFCPINIQQNVLHSMRSTGFFKDEDGHGANSINIALRRVARESGQITTIPGGDLHSNKDCHDTSEWQECRSEFALDLSFDDYYYFFQVSISRSDASKNILFGGIRLDATAAPDAGSVTTSEGGDEHEFFPTDRLPAENISHIEVIVDIGSDESEYLDFPVPPDANLLHVRFEPENGGPADEAEGFPIPSSSEALAELLRTRRAEGAPHHQPPVIGLQLYLDGNELNYAYVIVPEWTPDTFDYHLVGTGARRLTGQMSNPTDDRLRGRLSLLFLNIEDASQFAENRRQAALTSAVLAVKNLDALWLARHALRRHLAGYPTRMTPLEEQIRENLAQVPLSREKLEKIVNELGQFADFVVPRLVISEVKDADLDTFVDEELISKVLGSGILGTPIPKNVETAEKYAITLMGLKSHRCADDVGWEWGCDDEEPYVLWMCFGPGYSRVGRTEILGRVVRGSERWFKEDVSVFSIDPHSIFPNHAPDPLFFMYRVVESDPDGPSKKEIVGATYTAVALGTALYSQDWYSVAENGITFVIEMADIFAKVVGGGDDFYPIMWSVFNGDRLKRLTSGTTPLPLDVELFESEGAYSKLAIRVPKSDGWRLIYMIHRQ